MTNSHVDDGPDEKAPYTKLTTKVKRGTGTRDQDTVKVVTRHKSPHMAVKDHLSAVDRIKVAANAARAIQPGGDHDDA